MATDDRLYDLREADSHRFLVYSSANSYITPYSSDTHGGELITEFNQRAALNTLLKREVNMSDYAETVASAVNDFVGSDVVIDDTTGQTEKNGPGLNSFEKTSLHDKNGWTITAYATGTRDADDFHLGMDADGRITVSAGVALVYGYYVESTEEVTFLRRDAFTVGDITNVANNEGQISTNPCMTRFIKLAVQYTAPEHSRHDERLIPPFNGVYQGAAIVINEELPFGNELLLGTITIDSEGRAMLTENPYKTRMVPIDTVEGAEDYSKLLTAPEDEHIYGIKFGETGGSKDGEVTNLIDIDKWLWIAFDSNVGKLLRSMSTNADTAGNSEDEPTRGIIVSDQTPYTADDPVVDEFNCLQRIDAKSGSQFARISWHQAQTPPKTGADSIDHRALFFQYAMSRITGSSLISEKKVPAKDGTVVKPFYDVSVYPCLNGLNGTDGIITYQQLAMLELMFDDYVHRQADGYARGRQYGPFLTLADAKGWFERHKPAVQPGDYFWVINDTAEAGGTEANTTTSGYELQNIVTNYGTISGTVSGTAKQSKLEVPVSGSFTGTAHPESDPDETLNIEGEINGKGQGTINATVTGTVSGTLDSFTQNVSSRYTCRYHKTHAKGETGSWRFAHAVMLEENSYSGSFTSLTLQPNIRPGSLLISPIPNHPVLTDDNTGIYGGIYDNKYGKIMTLMNEGGRDVEVQVGTINYATGVITGLQTESTATISYFLPTDRASYVILDPEGESQFFQDTSSTPQSVLFTVEAVERGFAVPATSTTFGVVKVGPGSNLYDVIVDSTTQRLRITDLLLSLIKGGGFSEYPDETIVISPGVDLTKYAYRRYSGGVVFKMEGNASEWRANLDTTGTLAHIRGNITLDFSEVVEDGNRTDGLLLHLVDLDHVKLVGDNVSTTEHVSTETLLFGVDHCVVDKYFFTNIGEWKYSQFISGGNTLELDLPWMEVTNVFTSSGIDNSLMCKFSSVTMGEEGVCAAQMDIWVKHAGWKDYSGNIDRMWSSSAYLKYPPLFFEHDLSEDGSQLSTINKHTIQYIPDNLNLKISGTSGVHQAYDENNSEYVPSGNLLVNLNWEYNGNPATADEPGGKIYLNLYMKNASPDDKKQNFSNLRFRANVQVIRLDNNGMSESVSYAELY